MIVALKTIGYVISTLSVILLGIVAWRTAADDDFLRLCLIGGIAASIIGMVLRWISHLKDQREKDKIRESEQPAATYPLASAPAPANAERPAQARFYVAASDDPVPARVGSRGGSR